MIPVSKLKTIAAVAALAAGAAGAAVAVKKLASAYHLELENCTAETLNIYLGTEAAPVPSSLKTFCQVKSATSI